jgi:hypothetical protein
LEKFNSDEILQAEWVSVILQVECIAARDSGSERKEEDKKCLQIFDKKQARVLI